MRWKGTLINYLIEQLRDDKIWGKTIEKILIDSKIGIHLAIFNEPYLALIYKGDKKIESRFSINKVSPFRKIKKGDIVILKASGGMVTGAFIAGDIKFFERPDTTCYNEIRENYSKLICSHYDEEFWDVRKKCNYITLIEVTKVVGLDPFRTEKRDRSAWSVLRQGFYNDLLFQQ
ncbi:MAG: hypothetical protein EOO44_14540 [Flavobacterium sp.]|nr:MAG: hypothetical protein EOO44_14540 [Flavobacterium sp.]